MITKKELKEVFLTKETDLDTYYQAKELVYLSAFDSAHFKIYGCSDAKNHTFQRFSNDEIKSLEGISKDVPFLATHSSGVQLHFKTNSAVIKLNVKLKPRIKMYNMAFMGQCGFDLYYYDEEKGEYVYHNTSTPIYKNEEILEFCSELAFFRYPKERDIIIHFPLYIGVDFLEIGVEKDSYVLPSFYRSDKKIVIYGTSIIQGGCVSHPGLATSNVIARYFDQEVLNYGFSGAGLMEEEVAKIIASRRNIEIFIIDAEANAGCERWMYDNFDKFLNAFYAVYPTVPVVIMNKTYMSIDINSERVKRIKEFYDKFLKMKVRKYKKLGYDIRFVDNYHIFDKKEYDKNDMTVDGVHPNDLGMFYLSKHYIDVIKKIKKEGLYK